MNLPTVKTEKVSKNTLDNLYSLSSTHTRAEFIQKIPKFMETYWALEKDYSLYVDPETEKVPEHQCILRTACPLCDCQSYSQLFTKHGFDHALCKKCRMIFTLQILKEEVVHHIAESNAGNHYGVYQRNSVVNERDRAKYSYVMDLFRKFADVRSILDLGSNIGKYLDWASEDFNIVGHEYHTYLRDQAEAKGHTIYSEALGTMKFNELFDVITCWDYVDHLQEPRSVVRNLTKFLRPGGLFFFSINNLDSLSARVMHKESPLFIGPHHTMNYGIKQLELLMDGYELVDVESYVSELNWISNWLSFQDPLTGNSSLMTELLDPQKICELGMGFKLNAIFRKL